MFNIPIITYHKISNKKEIGLTTVSHTQFVEQLTYLHSNGYQTVCFHDIYANKTLPPKPVIITFDDGYESVYRNAIPIMEKVGYISVIFVVTDFIGKKNLWEAVSFQQKFKHLSEEQILELRDKGHEIASHGKRHKYLPILDQMSLEEEIEGSKNELENILRESVTSFCYPYGRYNNKIISIVKDAGYKCATSNPKIYNGTSFNPYTLTRRSIYSTDSMNNFIEKISPQTYFNFTIFTEILIQKGALASIGINFFKL